VGSLHLAGQDEVRAAGRRCSTAAERTTAAACRRTGRGTAGPATVWWGPPTSPVPALAAGGVDQVDQDDERAGVGGVFDRHTRPRTVWEKVWSCCGTSPSHQAAKSALQQPLDVVELAAGHAPGGEVCALRKLMIPHRPAGTRR